MATERPNPSEKLIKKLGREKYAALVAVYDTIKSGAKRPFKPKGEAKAK
jgi:hypothetical protein